MEEDRYTRITLRIPRDAHAKLETEAAKNSHSMNAEIVARLQSSFDENREVEKLRAELEEERMNVLKEQYEVLKMQNSAMDNENVLYILLDSNGYPIAWEEIYAYLDEIRRLSGKLPSKWETSIITPDVESSSQRAKQAVLITKKLRDVGISQALSRGSRLQAEKPSGDIEDAQIASLKAPVTVQGESAKVVLPKMDYETRDGRGQTVGAVTKPRKPASKSR